MICAIDDLFLSLIVNFRYKARVSKARINFSSYFYTLLYLLNLDILSLVLQKYNFIFYKNVNRPILKNTVYNTKHRRSDYYV